MPPDTVLAASNERTDTSLCAVIDALEAHGPVVAFQTALRTRSPLAHRAIARLASPSLEPEDLIDVARRPEDTVDFELDTGYLCVLAGLSFAQGDYEDSFALYSLAERERGGPIPEDHQTWYARSALHTGADVKGLLERSDGISDTDRNGIEADAVHPCHGRDEAAWLERFKTLTRMEDLELSDDIGPSYFDRLATAPTTPVRSKTRISIIMTCYRPGHELRTAIRSVLEQSWQNWELLLVDDCSGDEFHPILAECEALDPRIKLLLLPRNCGTYGARNRALAECTGSIVTGLDSDDWAHPRWLELQSAPILEDEAIILSISSAVRAFNDLTVTRSTRSIHSVRSTSIMFRAQPVRQHMGFFDEVRKGADTEFRMRFATVFGDRAIKRMTDSPLAIVRLSEASLTSSEFGMGWIHPYRWAYQSGQKHWHQKIRERKADPFISAGGPRRPFFAPSYIHSGKHDHGPFDEVMVADCRFDSEALRSVLDRAVAAAGDGFRVGIVHQESLLRPLATNRRIRPSVLRTLHEYDIAFLSPADAVDVARLVVSDGALWEGRAEEYALNCLGEIEIGSCDTEPVEPAEAPRRPPKRTSRSKVARSNRPGLWSYRKHAAAALAILYVTAVLAGPVLGARAAAIAAFFALAATLFLICLLVSSPGYRHLTAFLNRKLTR